jgi:hypothetical protein
MSRKAVVQFCQHIANTPELRTRLESGVKAGKGWDLIVAAGHEHGFDFTAHEAADCFEYERQRRIARESPSHAETHILRHSPLVADQRLVETLVLRDGGEPEEDSSKSSDGLSLGGLRRVALSHDWIIELSPTASDEDESIFS